MMLRLLPLVCTLTGTLSLNTIFKTLTNKNTCVAVVARFDLPMTRSLLTPNDFANLYYFLRVKSHALITHCQNHYALQLVLL